MSIASVSQVCSPPELPTYLRNVHDIKPIVGPPTDDELIGIHAIIQVANKVVDVQGVGDPGLLARISEHLFNVQMARHRSKYLAMIFPEEVTYTPPTLPAHISIHLEPITGAPSEEEVVKVQNAIRLYQQFLNAPSLFDPRVNMELSQHLFDIQMAKYIQRAKQPPTNHELRQVPNPTAAERTPESIEEVNAATNNAGTGALATESLRPGLEASIRDAIERSNQLAERANQLTQRANILMERSNELAERSNKPAEQPNKLAENFSEVLERLSEHFNRSDRLAEGLIKPVESISDVLKTINRVLVRVQHAIVRSHKGNTVSALDCLINEKGETPALSLATQRSSFKFVLGQSPSTVEPIDLVISGTSQRLRVDNTWLGRLLRFYGIAQELYDDNENANLKAGAEGRARIRLQQHLSSCLG